MKTTGEPNLRKRLDPELEAARRRAGHWTGRWWADGRWVWSCDTGLVCELDTADLAQHIADCHNHFLTLANALLFRERSEEDLNAAEPGSPARTLPRTAGSRRFPVPPSRPGLAGPPEN